MVAASTGFESTVADAMDDIMSLCNDVIMQARDSLMITYKFMNRSIVELDACASSNVKTCATDAHRLLFSPAFTLGSLRGQSTLVARSYLHMTLHCLLRHPFPPPGIDNLRWSTACDVAVAALLRELDSPIVSLADSEADRLLDEILGKMQSPTVQSVYSLFTREGTSEQKLAELGVIFGMDGHEAWFGDNSDESASSHDGETMQRWEKIARQTEIDIASDDANEAVSALSISLEQLEAAPMGLEELLRQFTAPRESICVNNDEFDYLYYTYGLSTYGNMPLIEPLEYRTTPEIRDFAVVIDTSGSVDEHLVKLFIEKACGMLAEGPDLGGETRVHLLHCDDEVRDEACLTSREDIEDYLADTGISGRGGTDFRPAFDRMDELLHNGTIEELSGLVYFTDGLGTFPQEPPPYDTAFVFVDELHAVPSWATAVLTYADELR